MTSFVPMVDLKANYNQIRTEIDAAVAGVLANTQFILGPNVTALEQELAHYLGVNEAICCASGTDALHLALRAANIGPGDEVITTAFSFIATAEAICYCGAKPVFVDIDPHTFNIDPVQVESAIRAQTKAILPVHLFGQPADMPSLTSLCQKHDLVLIEDCAQSFGAHINGKYTGTFGACGCFSFFPSKNLGCYGDGGLVTTHNRALASRLRELRNHGSEQRYYHKEIGYNSRLDELQAAILRVKLPHIDVWNQKRCQVAQSYQAQLKHLPLQLPYDSGIGTHVYHQYTLRCPTQQRDKLQQALTEANIASAIYYPIPIHKQKAFAQHSVDVALPVAERLARECLSLPIYPELGSAEIERIAQCLHHALA